MVTKKIAVRSIYLISLMHNLKIERKNNSIMLNYQILYQIQIIPIHLNHPQFPYMT